MTAPTPPRSVVQPTATYLFPLAGRRSPARSLRLLARSFAPAVVALAAGVAALLVGGTLLMWAASRWLVVPLRRLNKQVDGIAGGDPIETPPTSPIREVENVAKRSRAWAPRSRKQPSRTHDSRPSDACS